MIVAYCGSQALKIGRQSYGDVPCNTRFLPCQMSTLVIIIIISTNIQIQYFLASYRILSISFILIYLIICSLSCLPLIIYLGIMIHEEELERAGESWRELEGGYFFTTGIL